MRRITKGRKPEYQLIGTLRNDAVPNKGDVVIILHRSTNPDKILALLEREDQDHNREKFYTKLTIVMVMGSIDYPYKGGET